MKFLIFSEKSKKYSFNILDLQKRIQKHNSIILAYLFIAMRNTRLELVISYLFCNFAPL